MLSQVVVVLIAVILVINTTWFERIAQAATPAPEFTIHTASPAPDATTPSSETTLTAPALDVTPEDLDVPEPSWWQTAKRKFIRFFTFNQIKKQKINLELANLTLLRAKQAAGAGETATADEFIASYNQQITDLSQATLDILARLPQDSDAGSLADRLAESQVLQVELLDSLTDLTADQKFNTEIVKIRLEVIKKLTKLLTKGDLTPNELAEKIAKLEAKLVEKEAKAEEKLLRRLRLLGELDEATDDADLEDELEGRQRENLGNAGQTLPPETIGQIIRSLPGNIAKHIAVLQSVLEQVPASARPALEKMIEEELDKLAERIKDEVEAIEDAFEDAEDDDVLAAQKELAEKVRERLKKDQKLAEKLAEKTKRLQEKLEKQRDAAEAADDDEADQDGDGESPTATPTGTTPPTASPTATSSPSPTDTGRLEIEVEIQNFAYSKTLSLTKGRETRIRVRNRDSVSHTLTISDLGVSTGTIKPGDDERIEFTPTQSGSYTITCDFHPSMGGSATVN